MENLTVIYLAITCIITSLLWYIYAQKLKSSYSNLKTTYENLHQNLDKEVLVKADKSVKDLHQTISDLKTTVAETKHQSFQEGYNKARGEFSIKVFPYKEEHSHGDDGFFINDIYHQVEVGYQYQLFVNGIPVLQPAIIIEQVLSEQKRQVDFGKINATINAIEAKLKPIIADSKGLMKFIPGGKLK